MRAFSETRAAAPVHLTLGEKSGYLCTTNDVQSSILALERMQSSMLALERMCKPRRHSVGKEHCSEIHAWILLPQASVATKERRDLPKAFQSNLIYSRKSAHQVHSGAHAW